MAIKVFDVEEAGHVAIVLAAATHVEWHDNEPRPIQATWYRTGQGTATWDFGDDSQREATLELFKRVFGGSFVRYPRGEKFLEWFAEGVEDG